MNKEKGGQGEDVDEGNPQSRDHKEMVRNLQSSPMETCSAPWFVFFHDENRSQTYFSISDGRSYVRSITEIQKCRGWPTPQGWLLLIYPNPSSRYFLFNPVTMAKIKLPPLKGKLLPASCYCVLSSSPTDPNCMVMCADPGTCRLFFCHPGDRRWVCHESDLAKDDYLSSIIAFDGKFYALVADRDEFLVIDVASPRMLRSLGHVCGGIPLGLSASVKSLVESGGEMFVVVKCYKGRSPHQKIAHISVQRWNNAKKAWDSVNNIGDRVFFLGTEGFAASRSASELGVKGNCIYYIQLDDKRLYGFDLEEGTISVQVICSSLFSTPFWILPPL